jgi:hypothetical protein
MAENTFTMTSDDTLITQQYAATFRRSEHFDPEKVLVAAILDDAIQEYRKYSGAQDPKGKKRFREVEEWIMHGNNGWIFSFNNVCDFLGLDPDYIRHGLRISKDKTEQERRVQGDRSKRAA